jgi:hypothetical protein
MDWPFIQGKYDDWGAGVIALESFQDLYFTENYGINITFGNLTNWSFLEPTYNKSTVSTIELQEKPFNEMLNQETISLDTSEHVYASFFGFGFFELID